MKEIKMLACFAVGAIVGWIFASSITYVPQDALMEVRLLCIQRAVQRYYADNHRCPVSLTEVSGYEELKSENALEDLWGGPICYSVVDETNVVLRTCVGGDASSRVRQEFTLEFCVGAE